MEKQCELEAQPGGWTHDLLHSAGETSLNVIENIWKVTARNNQALSDLSYEWDNLQV